MKILVKLTILLLCAGVLAACNSASKQKEKYHRKIYLTEQDYKEDLMPKPHEDRREAKPEIESEYLFRVKPEKEIYFYDDRTRPLIPGEPNEREYKNTKRLHEKPKRYSPQAYHGTPAPVEPAAQESAPNAEFETYTDY